MMTKCLLISMLALVSLHGMDAAINIRGSLEANHLQASHSAATSAAPRTINWSTVGMGAGIGALVAGAVIGGAMFAMKKKDGEEEEKDEKGEPLLSPQAQAEPEGEKQVDYVQLIQNLTKKVSDEVGPKFSQGGSVRNVLENRMTNFQDKAKNFLLNEMNGTAGAVMSEMEAEESMLLLEWNNAVESNFPPASILIAGVLSPTVINFMSVHHFVQMITVGLPLFILCVFACYTDYGAPCSIPTIYAWLYVQTVLAFCLFVGHAALLSKLNAGKQRLKEKREEVEENLKGTGGFSNLKEQFIGNTIVLQEALIIENGVRHSFWNTVVGLATVLWLLATIWNLVLVAGWTFVPGVVAFHPKAAEVAGGDFCGAWATVLVLKICILLSVLYLFLNLATVVQWVCDVMIESKGFQDMVLTQARKADKGGTGLPIVEVIAKAFLLRGGDESIISQVAVVQHHKRTLMVRKAEAESKLGSLECKLKMITKEEDDLKDKTKDGGDLAAQVHKLSAQSVDYDSWRQSGTEAIQEAEAKAVEVGAASTEALEKLYDNINQVIEEVANSDTAKAAMAAAQEAQAMAQAKMLEAYDMVNDPEFQAKVREYAEAAQAQVEAGMAEAKNLADAAIATASDPEFQKQLQAAAQQAMDQAKAAADQAAAAVNDPELQKKLKEAMDQAQAAAAEAAAGINDPELQKKMAETAQNTLNQVKAGADSAAAALCDPEIQKQIQDAANSAMEDARAAAEQAAAAATDPKMREAALAKLKEAQEAAEKAAAVCQDPETKKKFEEAAQRAIDQAKAVGEEASKKAEELQKQLQEGATKAMADARAAAELAAKAATDPKLREAALKKLKEVQEEAEKAAAAAQDPEQRKQLQEAAKKAMEQAKTLAAEQIEKMSAAGTKAMDDARAAAELAAKAATDPKLKEAALAKLKEAQEAAEKAAAAAQDPETRKKLEEAAKNAMEQAKTLAAEQGEKAAAAAKEVAEKAGKK